MGVVTYPTLEHVAMQARPYPTDVLEGCDTGLVLFAAAFLGHNDAVHFAEAGIVTTCVDVDHDRLILQMARIYPWGWAWVNSDAWEYAENLRDSGPWFDVVSADTFTGAATRRSLDSLDLWCSLARKAVTVTFTAGEPYEVPDGWKDSLYERASGVYWLVLERE